MKVLIFLAIIFFTSCINEGEKQKEESQKKETTALNINGETLFKNNCASCHKPNERYIGPALQGSAARWESTELLYAFVRNSQEIISRNAYAKKLYEEYKQSPMLPYPNLTDNDIKDILSYCETYVAP